MNPIVPNPACTLAIDPSVGAVTCTHLVQNSFPATCQVSRLCLLCATSKDRADTCFDTLPNIGWNVAYCPHQFRVGCLIPSEFLHRSPFLRSLHAHCAFSASVQSAHPSAGPFGQGGGVSSRPPGAAPQPRDAPARGRRVRRPV